MIRSGAARHGIPASGVAVWAGDFIGGVEPPKR